MVNFFFKNMNIYQQRARSKPSENQKYSLLIFKFKKYIYIIVSVIYVILLLRQVVYAVLNNIAIAGVHA